MKKIDLLKRSFVGVCAATLLTGLCAAPAFAVEFTQATVEAGSETQYTDAAGSASTTVGVRALSNAQVSATVPTAVVAAVGADGTLTFPGQDQFKVVLGKTGDNTWLTKVSNLGVTLESGYKLSATDAVTSSNNLYLTLGGTALTETGNDVSSFVQSTVGTTTGVGLNMTGKVYGPTYQAMKGGKQVATLNWTISIV